ncbi:hypothetical protein RJ640_001606 [Escallonia rubra]|uniref:Glutaredoxin domain-containing protein n=1 Tax=Escallonia rubra TaxID=112253 RepID=A0AA88QGG3_9ASTE|nr:hypothetical protein RJ640_001606 [Escallonia rubra]
MSTLTAEPNLKEVNENEDGPPNTTDLKRNESGQPNGRAPAAVIHNRVFLMAMMVLDSERLCNALKSHNVPFEERDVRHKMLAGELESLTGQLINRIKLPVLFVNGRYIGGLEDFNRLMNAGGQEIMPNRQHRHGNQLTSAHVVRKKDLLNNYQKMCPPRGEGRQTVTEVTTPKGRKQEMLADQVSAT